LLCEHNRAGCGDVSIGIDPMFNSPYRKTFQCRYAYFKVILSQEINGLSGLR
jgi:hypothetical protein